MKPEEKAREEIDCQLDQCAWIVQNHKAINMMAGLGVAAREFYYAGMCVWELGLR